ncbi:hypothetical protein ACFLX2_00375 [Candidatus Dependentiae bacterium]
MNDRAQQPGYVLIFTLMLITLIVALVTSMANKSSVHSFYLKTMIDREKAKMLALSGVQIAVSQLATMHESSEPEVEAQVAKQEEKKEDSSQEEAKNFLINLLPVLNRWQTFNLTQKNDAITGKINVCIGCEEGKIDLNQLFDFVKKEFVNQGKKEKDYRKFMEEVFGKIQEIVGGDGLFDKFENFLKERQTELYDPTELLTIKEFDRFKDKIFFEPETISSEDKVQVKQTIYLNDIFTLWSFQQELNPWLLSHSLKIMLGIKEEEKKEEREQEEKRLQKTLEEFKVEAKWPNSWNNMLKPLYGIDFDSLPKEMKTAMGTKFEPTVFSVLSYGTVGDVTQKLFMILERIKSPKTEQTGKGKSSFEFRARKFYWL